MLIYFHMTINFSSKRVNRARVTRSIGVLFFLLFIQLCCVHWFRPVCPISLYVRVVLAFLSKFNRLELHSILNNWKSTLSGRRILFHFCFYYSEKNLYWHVNIEHDALNTRARVAVSHINILEQLDQFRYIADVDFVYKMQLPPMTINRWLVFQFSLMWSCCCCCFCCCYRCRCFNCLLTAYARLHTRAHTPIYKFSAWK